MAIKWQDHLTNDEVLEWANIPNIEAMLLTRLLHWAGHLPQMENMRMPKAVFYEDLRQANMTEEPQTTLSQRKTGRVWPKTGTAGEQLQREASRILKEGEQ